MLTVGLGGSDPHHRGQGPLLGRRKVVVQGLNVADLVVLLHVLEDGERVPDTRGEIALRHGWAGHRCVVVTVGLVAGLYVVRPRNVLVVQEPREVGPRVRDIGRAGVDGLVHVLLHLCRGVGAFDLVHAALGIGIRALCRPARDQVQMVGQRPRCDRFEHVVVECEVLRVGPVVRDLRRSVVAHDIWRDRIRTRWVVDRVRSAPLLALGRLGDESVHLPPVDVDARTTFIVWPATVDVGCVVVGRLTPTCRDGHTDSWRSILHGNAVGPRIRPEVAVE